MAGGNSELGNECRIHENDEEMHDCLVMCIVGDSGLKQVFA